MAPRFSLAQVELRFVSRSDTEAATTFRVPNFFEHQHYSTMHEIVTLQFGNQSNYLGTHFWNEQVNLTYAYHSD